jgi:hypothetical protein
MAQDSDEYSGYITVFHEWLTIHFLQRDFHTTTGPVIGQNCPYP